MHESVPLDGVSLELLEVRTSLPLPRPASALQTLQRATRLPVRSSFYRHRPRQQRWLGRVFCPLRPSAWRDVVQVGQTDKVADPRIELRVRHRHTMRADAANTQVASLSVLPSMSSTALLLSITSTECMKLRRAGHSHLRAIPWCRLKPVQCIQARDAERFTRLVRKQEPGSGPLRYSIELRRSAGEAFCLETHHDGNCSPV